MLSQSVYSKIQGLKRWQGVEKVGGTIIHDFEFLSSSLLLEKKRGRKIFPQIFVGWFRCLGLGRSWGVEGVDRGDTGESFEGVVVF